jgi:catechol 2,3-dioxygenase-like lactoylglutathione lyase family enzyme
VTTPSRPFIECEQLHAGLAVEDIRTAIDFYVNKLGFVEAFTWGDPPTFAGVNLDKVQISTSISSTPSTAPTASRSR